MNRHDIEKETDYKKLSLAGNQYENIESFRQAVAEDVKLDVQELANIYGKISYADVIEYAERHEAKEK